MPAAVRAFERDTTSSRPRSAVTDTSVCSGTRLGPDPGPMLPFLGASVAAVASSAGLCATGILCPGDILARFGLGDRRGGPGRGYRCASAGRCSSPCSTPARSCRARRRHRRAPARPTASRPAEPCRAGPITGSSPPARARRSPAGGTTIFASRSRRRRRPGSPAADARRFRRADPAPRRGRLGASSTPTRTGSPSAFRSASGCPSEVDETERALRSGLRRDRRRRLDALRSRRFADPRHRAGPSRPRDEVTLDVELARPVWGYRARWDRNDLLLDIRRPPAIDAGRSAPRPAHRGGSGPSARRRHRSRPGLREAEANLAVALELRRLLEDAGAKVLMTRTDATAPWTSGPGSSWPSRPTPTCWSRSTTTRCPTGSIRSPTTAPASTTISPAALPLARAIQAALVRRLGHPRPRDSAAATWRWSAAPGCPRC